MRRFAGHIQLTVLCAAQFVVVLDLTIVAVALPSMRRDLGFSDSALQLVVSAYGVTFGGLLLAAGRLGDAHGHRRLFAAGLAVFGAASVACALAPSAAALVAARAFQGAGAAGVAPNALALLTGVSGGERGRRRAVALWTAAAAGGGASGWVLGGVLTERLGWPSVFLVAAPIALAGAVLAPRTLPAVRADGVVRRIDGRAAVAATAGIGLAVLGLSRAQAGGSAALTAATLAAAGVLLAAFVALERRAEDPLVPRGLLERGRLAAPVAASAALTAATTPPIFLCVLLLQAGGRSPAAAGLVFAPFNLAVIGGSLAGPRAVRRAGARAAIAIGLVGVAAGIAVLSTGAASGPPRPAAVAAGLVVMGAALGIGSVAATDAGTAAAGPRRGAASGVLTAAAQLGTAAGLAVLVPVAAAVATSARAGGATAADALAIGARPAFAAAAALALAAAAATPLLACAQPKGVRPL